MSACPSLRVSVALGLMALLNKISYFRVKKSKCLSREGDLAILNTEQQCSEVLDSM